MEWYQTALLVGSCVTMLASWNLPRARFWILMGAVSFAISSWYWNAGLPYPSAFGAGTNLIICFFLYALAVQQWELRVWNCFHLMIAIDILWLLGWIDNAINFVNSFDIPAFQIQVESHYVFAVMLELCNWLALAVIFTTGLLERFYVDRTHHGSDWLLGAVSRSLRSKRALAPFWRVTA